VKTLQLLCGREPSTRGLQSIPGEARPRADRQDVRQGLEAGFSLVEFAIACALLLVLSGAVFGMLAQTQVDAGHQGDVQAVNDDARHAMDSLSRYLHQAGNDPHGTGLVGIEISGPTEVRLKSDLTGSEGPANPDKGDPDGDTLDAAEDVTIRYNAAARSIEVQPGGGTTQTLVNNVSAFSLQYFDGSGGSTNSGAKVCKVRINLTATSPSRNLRTGGFFSLSLTSDVQILARQ
jgi:hypothetical protein